MSVSREMDKADDGPNESPARYTRAAFLESPRFVNNVKCGASFISQKVSDKATT